MPHATLSSERLVGGRAAYINAAAKVVKRAATLDCITGIDLREIEHTPKVESSIRFENEGAHRLIVTISGYAYTQRIVLTSTHRRQAEQELRDAFYSRSRR